MIDFRKESSLIGLIAGSITTASGLSRGTQCLHAIYTRIMSDVGISSFDTDATLCTVSDRVHFSMYRGHLMPISHFLFMWAAGEISIVTLRYHAVILNKYASYVKTLTCRSSRSLFGKSGPKFMPRRSV